MELCYSVYDEINIQAVAEVIKALTEEKRGKIVCTLPLKRRMKSYEFRVWLAKPEQLAVQENDTTSHVDIWGSKVNGANILVHVSGEVVENLLEVCSPLTKGLERHDDSGSVIFWY
jgi:hypothetical protein